MSKAKSISALAAGVTMLAASCWFVTGALPLKAAPQVVEDASGVSVEMNGAQLMHRQPVAYPSDAMLKGIQGTVVAQVKLDAAGNVRDASILSGPEELRKAVLQSVLNWRFSNEAALSTRQVSIAFQLPQRAPQPATAAPEIRAAEVPRPTPQAAILKAIIITGLSDQQRDELLARLPVHEGDALDFATVRKVAEAVFTFDEHLNGEHLNLAVDHGAGTIRISLPGVQSPGAMPPPPPPPPGAGSAVQSPPAAIRVVGNVAATNLITKVVPVYPLEAKAARIQGTVRFEATIGKDGTVQNLHLIAGPPLLVRAATEAVQQWVYRPTLWNGNPIGVITTVDVNFTLSQ
jgi:TonB family protein